MDKSFFVGVLTAALFLQFPEMSFSQFQSNPSFGVNVIQSGLWATVNNPAGLAKETTTAAGIYYHSPFLLQQMATSGVTCAVPIGNFSIIGLSYQRFGYSLYKEQKARVALAKQIGKMVSVGIRFDYLNTGIGEGYGSASSITGTAGLMVQITDELRAGMSLFNPQRAKISKSNTTRHPVNIEGGVAWQFGKHAEIAFGVSKPGNANSVVTAAVDYRFSEKFNVSAGFSNGLYPVYFGYSFSLRSIAIEMNSGYHTRLGFSPQILCSYKKR